MTKLLPTLHKEIPMNTRVAFPVGYSRKEQSLGRVIGIARHHAIFMYIVLLDKPTTSLYGEESAIVVSGTDLEGETGEHWRLK
jgi:alpha-D-ribose 1-methylphosphonate 5-triphosphate synthase subunit PhnL